MFKKPTAPVIGKENFPRPRLGMSSLMHGQAASRQPNDKDIESAGASLKVLKVENARQTKTSPQKMTDGTSATTTKPKMPNHASSTGTAIAASSLSSQRLPSNTISGGKPTATVTSVQQTIKNEKPAIGNAASKTVMNNKVDEVNKKAAADDKEVGAAYSNPNSNADNGGIDVKSEKPADGCGTQTKKGSPWELSNFDIGRALGRGKFGE